MQRPDLSKAKTRDGETRFLQIVAKANHATRRKSKKRAEPKLTRVAFRVSRLMEFCSLRELQNQTGHSYYDWLLVILKELMDNGIDGCEEAEVAPVMVITVTCGGNGLPLFVLHDFDVAGFMILGTLQRDTRRYAFSNTINVVDLGVRLEDIEDLEREPAAATKTRPDILREQLAENGATGTEIDILLDERVELNAMPSNALIEMIERKLNASGIEKVVPDHALLAEAYQAFHHSRELQNIFEKAEEEEDFEASELIIPKNLKKQVRKILDKHTDLRWDDAIQIVLDGTQLDRVRAKKQEAKKKSGDFTGSSLEDDD